ncbi:MAG: hypothetical protein V1749_10230 [Candidatus Desantisbacteria bacterium]
MRYKNLIVERRDGQFRLVSSEFQTMWLQNISLNRKAMMLCFRMLQDKKGKWLYTHSTLSAIVGSKNRQASSSYMEEFRDCGEDIFACLSRKRKVDKIVVEVVAEELKKHPLAKTKELCDAANSHLNREDLTEANIDAALEQIPCKLTRAALSEQILCWFIGNRNFSFNNLATFPYS